MTLMARVLFHQFPLQHFFELGWVANTLTELRGELFCYSCHKMMILTKSMESLATLQLQNFVILSRKLPLIN